MFPIQVEHSVLELLVDNLSRLNEGEESDKQGVFHILGILTSFYRGITDYLERCLREYSWI